MVGEPVFEQIFIRIGRVDLQFVIHGELTFEIEIQTFVFYNVIMRLGVECGFVCQ